MPSSMSITSLHTDAMPITEESSLELLDDRHHREAARLPSNRSQEVSLFPHALFFPLLSLILN